MKYFWLSVQFIALATMNGCAYDLVNLYQAGSIEHTHENVDKYKKKWEV